MSKISELNDLARELDRHMKQGPAHSFFMPNDGANIRWAIEQNAALVAALEHAEAWITHTSAELPQIKECGTYHSMLKRVRAALALASNRSSL